MEEMDKVLEMYNLPRLNQKKKKKRKENISKQITSTEIETMIKNPPTNKSPES